MILNNYLNVIKNKIKNRNKILLPVLEIHVTDHCNLNCKGCSHFSNIADKYFITAEELKQSLTIAAKKFRILSFAFVGGEPLLHPNLAELLSIARDILPGTRLVITTNGLLINSMPQNLWDSIIKNNVYIDVSKYPINSSSFSALLDEIAQRNVLGHVYVKNYFRKYLNLKGNSSRHLTYEQCYAKHCVLIKGNFLYKCPFSLYVKYFNKKYEQRIPVSEGLNLKTASNRKIKYFLNNPIEGCSYCSFLDDDIASFPWELSEHSQEDWCI
jgi:organic radical activating enzyme